MSRARILADYVSSGDELAVTTATADAALPKAGGAMTGAITTNCTFDGVDIAARDAIHAPKASPTFTGTVAIPNVANLETAVVANTAKVTNSTNASDLASGTVPDARFPATLPAASGANLTALPAANVTGVLPAGVTGGSGLTALGTVASGTIGTAVKLANVTSIASFALGTGDTSTSTMSLSANTRYMCLSQNVLTSGAAIYPVVTIIRFDGTTGSVESENNSFAGSTVWNWTFGTNTAALRVNHASYTTSIQVLKIGGI